MRNCGRIVGVLELEALEDRIRLTMVRMDSMDQLKVLGVQGAGR